jgi:hypothetical protein
MKMKRRAFCAGGLTALTAATMRYRHTLAATTAADMPAIGLDGRQLTLKGADVDDLRAGSVPPERQHQAGGLTWV